MTYQIKRIRLAASAIPSRRTRRWTGQAQGRTQTVQAGALASPLGKLVQRLMHDLTEDVVPRPQLLRDEEIQIEIHQAWYRHRLPYKILHEAWITLLITLSAMVMIGFLATWLGVSPLFSLVAFLLPPMLLMWATQEMMRYKQWQLLVTNRRTIVYMPAPRSRFLVDNVRLQAGKIQVVDVSFSPNRWWRIFQLLTGARDLVISISGYEFKPDAAEVKGGLIIPDVMREDITRLEEIVFPLK